MAVVKDGTRAIRRFWRACICKNKPAGQRDNLIFVRIEFAFLDRSQFTAPFTLKPCVILAHLFQKTRCVQGLDRERREIHWPAILHTVALFSILALRASLELVSAIPTC